ncbi:MAG: hypothetical protein PQJ49_00905 [Sphaerochaetaceae bacterium]|nr:hypothetical protein [Sphaerochaetaceae bacterium]
MNKIYILLLVSILTITPIFATTDSNGTKTKFIENYVSFRNSPTLESKAFADEPSINYHNEFDLIYSFFLPGKNYGFYMKDNFYLTNNLNIGSLDIGVSYKHKLSDNLNLFTTPYATFSLYDKGYDFYNYYLGVGGEIALRYKITNNLQIETGAEAKALYLIDNYDTNVLDIDYRYSVNAFIGFTFYFELEYFGTKYPSNVVYVHLI